MSLLDRMRKAPPGQKTPSGPQAPAGAAPTSHGGGHAAGATTAPASGLSAVEDKVLETARSMVFDMAGGPRAAPRKPGEDEKDYYSRIGRDVIIKVQESLGTRLSMQAQAKILQELLDGIVGFGKLQRLLEDDTVSELMVNGPRRIYVERKGKVVLADVTFRNNDEVMQVIQKIISPLGRRCDNTSPMVDARLPDGSRVNAVIPPLALNGPCLSIRKFSKKPLSIADLVRFGAMTQEMADFLQACVKARLNMVVAGGTGSGKTTTLNVISGFIPEDERIVTIEDSAELRLQQDHVVSLETRPPNIEGKGAVTIRDLVKNSLRMRPERIVVGECRGGETLDMLQAMNTGHDGSLTTAHANTPEDAVRRVETMVMMAGMDLPMRNIREQIASAVDIIIQQTRLQDGSRKITSITEVDGMDGDKVLMREIFAWFQEGLDANGKVIGELRATGEIPSFLHKFEEEGIPLPDNVFGKEIHLPTLMEELNKRRHAEQAEEKAKLREILLKQIAEDEASDKESEAAGETKGTLMHWAEHVAPPGLVSPLMARREAALKKGNSQKEVPLSEEDRYAQLVMGQIAANENFEKELLKYSADEQRTQAKNQAGFFLDMMLRDSNKAITQVKRSEILNKVADEVLGLGPIQQLLDDPSVAEVMVNGPEQIFVERKGKLELMTTKFRDDAHARQIINRIVGPLGRRCDDSSPMVDARLKDGSRVNAIIAPASLIGPVITIRKFSKKPLGIPELIKFGALSSGMADFLKACVEVRLNCVVSGGTGSGKTTTLNALSSFIPDGERIVTIEDAAELRLQQTHVVSLESRPPNQEGKGAIPIRDLVRNSLRMRPDRIVVGECRGGETLDMLQAMNTGKDGSMTTGHANTPEDIVSRIETMVMMAGLNIPMKNIREQIASGVHLIVQQSRLKDGSRRLVSITEVAGMAPDGRVHLRDIFSFKQHGLDANGKVIGTLAPTGEIPGFLYKMREARITLPEDIFGPQHSYSKLLADDEKMRFDRERAEEARNRALMASQGYVDEVVPGVHYFSYHDLEVAPPPKEPATSGGALGRLRGLGGNVGSSSQKDEDKEREKMDMMRGRVMRLMTEDQDMQQRIKMAGSKADEQAVLPPLVYEAVERENNLLRAGLGEKGKKELAVMVLNDVMGFGPIQPLLSRDDISEVMVNGPKKIFYECKGKVQLATEQFRDDAHVMHIISKIVTPLGRRCDHSSPIVDARLPDGSRVNAIIPPLALCGPTLTIRKFSKKKLSIMDMVKFNSMTYGMAKFMEACVELALNIVVSGGTGSGKTTTLNALSGFIPEDERIVTVEDSAELQLQQSHVVSLETRPANIEGKGLITIRDLIKNCLRMRPDRVVVGECRSGETLDMLQAMNTGHEGSLTTAHANTPKEMMGRLEVMVLMAGTNLPSRAIREQIASAVDLVIQQNRFHDGSRRITHITEVTGITGDDLQLEDIFRFEQTGLDPVTHKVSGHHVWTGHHPSFLPRLFTEGIELPDDCFGEGTSVAKIVEEMKANKTGSDH
jgi:pilus assembly protein CpaF